MQAPKRLLEIARRAGDDYRSSGRRTADIGEWRRVSAQILIAELQARVARVPVRDCPTQQPLRRQNATPEREGASDDPAASIDHLDRELSAPERRVQRAGSGQHSRSGSGQLRDLDSARVQRPVEGTMKMTGDEYVDAGADDDNRKQDRQRRRSD